jgi:ribosomal protein L11 methyltransferase
MATTKGQSVKEMGGQISGRTEAVPGPQQVHVGRGEKVLVIDPKEAFGDGAHPSTRLALRLLDDLFSGRCGSPDIQPGWVLDAGCGTGVLALAAATLADLKVFAVDISARAVDAAAGNLRRNSDPGSRVFLACGELACAQGPFGLVLANLAPSVHFRAGRTLWEAAAPGGWLILSGFFDIQKTMVLGPYVRHGATEKRCLLDDTWAGSLLKKPISPCSALSE